MAADLRVVKTERSIREAFIKLRAAKPTNKITVKELCEEALINKATFYLHYKDIYELSDMLENKLITDCLATISDEDAGSLEKVVFDFAKAFSSQSALFHILFSDGSSDADKLAGKVTEFVQERVFSLDPHLRDDISFNIRLTAAVYGGFHAFFAYKHVQRPVAIAHIADFVQRTLGSDARSLHTQA